VLCLASLHGSSANAGCEQLIIIARQATTVRGHIVWLIFSSSAHLFDKTLLLKDRSIGGLFLLVNGYFWNELKSRIFIEVDDLWRKKAVGKVRAGHLTDGRHDPCIFSVPP
jgi:hypothetical protein